MLPNIHVLLSTPEGIMGFVLAAGIVVEMLTRIKKPPMWKWLKRKRK